MSKLDPNKIIHEIEEILLKDDKTGHPHFGEFLRKKNGWIPLEIITSYCVCTFDDAVQILRSRDSKYFECDWREPVSIRLKQNVQSEDEWTKNGPILLVKGFPIDAKYEEIKELFSSYSPVEKIKMLEIFNSFNGSVLLKFVRHQDMFIFLDQSGKNPIYFTKHCRLGISKEYPLDCRLLPSGGHELISKFPNASKSGSTEKLFSTRLNKAPSNASLLDSENIRFSTPKNPSTVLESRASAIDQILFCQNSSSSSEVNSVDEELNDDSIVTEGFSYKFYKPIELLYKFQEDAVEFNNIQRDINFYYQSRQDTKLFVRLYEISPSLPVVCKTVNSPETDPVWYRSRILNYNSRNNTVDLFYVDFGTWEINVSIDRLRHLVKKFSQYLVFSVTCALAAVAPLTFEANRETWPEEVNQEFISILTENKLQVELLEHASNDRMTVNLFVQNINHTISVADYLVSNELAKAISWNSVADATQQNMSSNGRRLTDRILHPVIELYHQIQQRLPFGQDNLIDLSSLSTISQPRMHVKLLRVQADQQNSDGTRRNSYRILFVLFDNKVWIPDSSIISLLDQGNASRCSMEYLSHYAWKMREAPIHLTAQMDLELFDELSSLIPFAGRKNAIVLYTPSFVRMLLEERNFSSANVFRELKVVQQLSGGDPYYINRWFNEDNDLELTSTAYTSPNSDSSHLSHYYD